MKKMIALAFIVGFVVNNFGYAAEKPPSYESLFPQQAPSTEEPKAAPTVQPHAAQRITKARVERKKHTIADVPPYSMQEIFEYLPYAALASMMRTSRYMRGSTTRT